jgi:hypothetical protein
MTVLSRLWKILGSLKLTIVCLSMLMALVIACTLAQVDLGSYEAVKRTINAFVVWVHLPGTSRRIPVFPGGATVGLVLLANLLVAQIWRLQLRWSKAGMWLAHLGVVLLFVGQFVTGWFQVEMRMPLEVGETKSYLESPRDDELVISDLTDPAVDDEYAVPERILAREQPIDVPGTPIRLEIKAYYRNAAIGMRAATDPPAIATAGVGTSISAVELPPVTSDDEADQRAVFVEPIAGGHSYGTWLVSPELGAPQWFMHEGRKYGLSMRPHRAYLPYSVTLEKFSHDIYLGTDIPKNFSSLVRLSNPKTGESREVLIYMNHPLRYEGKAFYQASFGKGDTLSILQVVGNPGWLIPYLACAMVASGLLWHFGLSLRRGLNRRQRMAGATA